MKQTPE